MQQQRFISKDEAIKELNITESELWHYLKVLGFRSYEDPNTDLSLSEEEYQCISVMHGLKEKKLNGISKQENVNEDQVPSSEESEQGTNEINYKEEKLELNKLEREAELQEYTLKLEEKDKIINKVQDKYKNLLSEKEQLDLEVSNLKNTIEEKNRTIDSLQNELKQNCLIKPKFELKITEQNIELAEKQAIIDKLNKKLSEAILHKPQAELKIAEYQVRLEEKERAYETLKKNLYEVNIRKLNLEKEIKKLKETTTEINNAKHLTKIKELSNAVYAKQVTIKSILKKYNKLVETMEKYTNKCSRYEESVNNLTYKNDVLMSLLKKKSSNCEELSKQLNETKGILETTQSKLSSLEKTYKEKVVVLRSEIDAIINKKQVEWESYYKQINNERQKELLSLQKSHEERIQKLKEILRSQKLEIESLKASRNPFKIQF